MRIERQHGNVIRVVLSRRNLLTLLTKLDWPESHCTIENDGVYVSSESDQTHYAGRVPPGEMHPVTEAAIKDAKS